MNLNGMRVFFYVQNREMFFLNGFMHMLEYSMIVAMDMEEKTWRTIHKPHVVLKCPSIKLRVTCMFVVLIFTICLSF